MKKLNLYFLNVGQGDSIYAEYKTGELTWHMLIDCNREPENGIDVLKFLKDYVKAGSDGKQHLDYLFVTHPHDDHIRGLGDIADELVIDTLWDSGHIPESSDGDVYKAYEKVKTDCENRSTLAEKSTTYEVETICDGELEVLVMRPSKFVKDRSDMTDDEMRDAIHTECMVLKLTFGDFSLMVTGDSNLESWKWIADESKYADDDLKCTVLHGIHHGSKTAFWDKDDDTEEVDAYTTALEKMSPERVVISVGKDNQYDLPNEDALQIYKDQVSDSNVFLTSEGTVVCEVTEDGTYSLRRDMSGIDKMYMLTEEGVDDEDDGKTNKTVGSASIWQSKTRLDDKPSAKRTE